MKKLVVSFAILLAITMQGQTIKNLKSDIKIKKESIKKLKGEVAKLESTIKNFPGWKFGVFGTVGANFSGFNNWYQQRTPNSSSANIGISVNGLANLDRKKFFWRNSVRLNLGWVKFDDKDKSTDDNSYKTTTDLLNLNSLYGYKLSKSWAASAFAEYRTSVIDNFNNPGYLDLGLGTTWTPIKNLLVVFHPLNYNIVLSKSDTNYKSSLGTKIVADYTKMLTGGINFKSNFTTFVSYKGWEFANWTWTNNIAYTFWKGIGLGLECGLRGNKQEFIHNDMTINKVNYATALSKDNKLQSFWLLGLSFAF